MGLRLDAQGRVVDENGQVSGGFGPCQPSPSPVPALPTRSCPWPSAPQICPLTCAAAASQLRCVAPSPTPSSPSPPSPPQQAITGRESAAAAAASAAAAGPTGSNPYFDESRQWELRNARPTKALRFHEPGFYQEIAKKERARVKLDKLQQEIATAAKRTSA